MILGVIDELKDNYDGKHYVSLTNPESRKNAHERWNNKICILITNSQRCKKQD